MWAGLPHYDSAPTEHIPSANQSTWGETAPNRAHVDNALAARIVSVAARGTLKARPTAFNDRPLPKAPLKPRIIARGVSLTSLRKLTKQRLATWIDGEAR